MTKVLLEAQALADIVIKALQEVKGQEILKMDLRNSDGSVTDFFLICTGTSDRHVTALGDSVLKFVKEAGEIPHSKEGFEKGDWVLIDYINVVVHIFQEESRNFYRLEKLWGDAEFERIAEG